MGRLALYTSGDSRGPERYWLASSTRDKTPERDYACSITPSVEGQRNTRRSPIASAVHCRAAASSAQVMRVRSPARHAATCAFGSPSAAFTSARCCAISARPGLVWRRSVLRKVAPFDTRSQNPCLYPVAASTRYCKRSCGSWSGRAPPIWDRTRRRLPMLASHPETRFSESSMKKATCTTEKRTSVALRTPKPPIGARKITPERASCARWCRMPRDRA